MATFSDILVTQRPKGISKLEKMEALINWEKLRYRINKVVDRCNEGRPAYDVIKMFKVLVLQQIYDLSDPQAEEMLYDRISFRRFCGFALEDNLPDETTICRFRALLQGKTESLLSLVNEELSKKGIAIGGGRIIDATLIQSKAKPPCGGEVSEQDPQAGWTKKQGKFTYGYKMHACVDDENGLITSQITTSADVHDSQVFEQLLWDADGAVYADKAYDSEKNRNFLKENGLKDCLLYKGKKGKKTPNWQTQFNKINGKVRSGVERTFAHIKTKMNRRIARYCGWDKNQVHNDLIAIGYNIWRCSGLVNSPPSV